MDNDVARVGDLRPSNPTTDPEHESREADDRGINHDAVIDSASSAGGSSNKSSKPPARDFDDVSPSDERRTRKRHNDVLYSRNRRQRERNEADSLRDHSATLARTNEALKKEETRLLHLYVDATKAIEDLNSKVERRTDAFPSPETKTAATAFAISQSGKESAAGACDGQSPLDLQTVDQEQALNDSSRTDATDPSSPLASFLPLLLQHASNMPICSPPQNVSVSQDSGSIHRWKIQELLQRNVGNSSTPSTTVPHPHANAATRLLSELYQRSSSLSDTIVGGGTSSQPSATATALQTIYRDLLAYRMNPTAPGTDTPLPPAPLSPGLMSQNTSVEAALLESLVCSILSGSPTPERFTQFSASEGNAGPSTALSGRVSSLESTRFSTGEAFATSHTIASSQPERGVSDEGNNNLLKLLETLLATRNNAKPS